MFEDNGRQLERYYCCGVAPGQEVATFEIRGKALKRPLDDERQSERWDHKERSCWGGSTQVSQIISIPDDC